LTAAICEAPSTTNKQGKKNMTFHIAPFAGQTYASRYASHHDIRAYLGWGKLVERSFGGNTPYTTVESKRLPLDFCESGIWVPLTDGRSALLYCKPGNPSVDGRRGKSSAHRCFVTCPDCGASVPAGRTHQHKCK
jgi:hypothetical protein